LTIFPIIRGLILAQDRRQVPDKFVVAGRNFLVNTKGPFSAFGSVLITYEQLKNAHLFSTFRVQGKIFLFGTNAVFEYDTGSELYLPLYTFTENLSIYPWTTALVGGVYYFLKQGGVIISYNPLTDKWDQVTANVPTNPYFIIQSAGRLIILGSTVIGHSALDNGTDLATDIEKKVGQQSIAIGGGGSPLALLPVADGFLAYLDTGIIKAQTIDSLSPFRYDALTNNTDFIPLSQYTIILMGVDVHVMLTKSGFYTTTGGLPEVFQPLMNEFFKNELLPTFDLSVVGVIKLTYFPERRWFFVSIAETQIVFKFSLAYVLDLARDEWGSFNRNHQNFGELSIADGIFKGFNFGYFCLNGCLHRFVDTPSVQAHPDRINGDKLPGNFHLFHIDFEGKSRFEQGVAICVSNIQMETFDESVFQVGSNLYEFDVLLTYLSPSTAITTEQVSVLGTPNLIKNDLNMQGGISMVGWKQYANEFQSIDASIDVGLFAAKTELLFSDEMTLVTDLALGMPAPPDGQMSEDWFTFQPDISVDWLNDVLSDEDYGAGAASGVVYDAEIIGTLDGTNTFQDQREALEERDDIVDASLDENTGDVKHFICYNNGVYHIIRINALEVDQSFFLRIVDLQMKPGGVF